MNLSLEQLSTFKFKTTQTSRVWHRLSSAACAPGGIEYKTLCKRHSVPEEDVKERRIRSSDEMCFVCHQKERDRIWRAISAAENEIKNAHEDTGKVGLDIHQAFEVIAGCAAYGNRIIETTVKREESGYRFTIVYYTSEQDAMFTEQGVPLPMGRWGK